MTDEGVARRAAELASKVSEVPNQELAAAPPPVAKGLNRNVLIVLGAIVGITALVAVTYTSSFTTARARGTDSVAVEAPRPQRPAFLDIPPKMATVDSARVSHVRRDSVQLEANVARELADLQAVEARRHEHAVRSYRGGRLAPDGAHSIEAEYWKALAAPVMLGVAAERPGVSGEASVPAESTMVIPSALAYTQGPAQSSPTQALDDRNGRERESFLANARGRDTEAVVQDSAGVLLAGTVISAELLTNVNSDLPGDIVAQVTRDVFDSRTQRVLLIPKGSRLMGRYDDRVVTGQSRLLVAWTRLVLADGRSIALPGFQGTDSQGASGITGEVDQHIGQQFGDALLLSLLGAGVELSQPKVGVYGAPSVGAVAGGALGQELSNVALELVRRHADVPPTISVPLGSRFDVYVNRDLVPGRSR